MALEPSWVVCGGRDGEGMPRHPMIAENGKPAGVCHICELQRRLSSSRSVMQEVLDAIVEGRVVAAADGLRGWLNASAPNGGDPR